MVGSISYQLYKIEVAIVLQLFIDLDPLIQQLHTLF